MVNVRFLMFIAIFTAGFLAHVPARAEEDFAEEMNESGSPPAVLGERSRWHLLLPAFVIHGIAPSGGANYDMPRKLDPGGRAVATPGVGIEFRGASSFDALFAYVKDCYDNPAGTIQFGQHFAFGTTSEFGYTLGLYVRKTPLTCLTETVTTRGSAGGGGPGGRGNAPAHTNTFTATSCGFEDNLPLRYTFSSGSDYVDIVPTPFLHFSTELFRVPFPVHLKIMGNYYLNEFGLAIPF